MADLFISHSSMDVDWTRDLRRQLETAGYSVWMAPDDVNGPVPWAEQILKAIEDCRVMIVVVSRHANASAHVSKEVGAALEHDKPLLPIRTEAIVPTGSLNYLLQLVQWIDAFPGTLADHLERIRRAVAYSIPAAASAGGPGDSTSTAPGAAMGAAASAFPASYERAATPPAWSAPHDVGAYPPPPAPPAPPAFSNTVPQSGPSVGPSPAAQYPGTTYLPPTVPWGAGSGTAPARPTPNRGPLLIAGAAGLVAAVVIVGGLVAFAPRPGPTPGFSPFPTQFGGGSFVLPTAPPSGLPSAPPSAFPSAPPSVIATGIPSAPPSSSPPVTIALSASEVAALIPRTVGGVNLVVQTQTGEQAAANDPATQVIHGFLARHGKADRDLLLAGGHDSTNSTDLQIYVFYVAGIDPAMLMDTVIVAEEASVSGVQMSSATISGKDVTQAISSSMSSYLFTDPSSGSVIVVVTRDPQLAALAIRETPAGV